jgi:hypothetical protein
VSFSPNTLNLSSSGNWVRAYIEPADGSAAEIDVSTILLNGQVPAEPYGWALVDNDDDGLTELMVLFNRQAVAGLIEPSAGQAELVVTGTTLDGASFEALGSIKVVSSAVVATVNAQGKAAKANGKAAKARGGSRSGAKR